MWLGVKDETKGTDQRRRHAPSPGDKESGLLRQAGGQMGMPWSEPLIGVKA